MYGIKQKKGKRNEKSEGNQEKSSRILPETSCTADPAVSLATQISFVLNLFYAAITIGTTVMVVYFLLNLDEMIKLPAVYRHYKKYQWVNNITREDTEQ